MKNDTKKTADFLRRLEDFRLQYRLYGAGDRLLVALSGGKDSVCLLRVLADQRERLGLSLYAAHVHHGLRAEAEEDLAFCRRLCQELGVELFVCRVDAAQAAKERKMGVEEAGRQLRYEYFFRLQEQLGTDHVLTAHTASDQCETAVMRLTRGAGLRGLCAIAPKREGLCRPLLCVTAQEVCSYLQALGQEWAEDESNGSDAYCRNRMRNQILPLLKEENPSLEQTVLRNTLALRREWELLEALCRQRLEGIGSPDALVWNRAALKQCCGEEKMAGLFFHVVSRAAESLGVPTPSAERCEAMRRLAMEAPAGKEISFAGGRMRVGQNEICFSPEGEEPVGEYWIPLGEKTTPLPPIDAEIRRFSPQKSENYKNINKMLMIMKINSATISGGLVARSRREQDSIIINRMTKRVKKLLCDAKLPIALRRRIPVIADEEGIVWIPGVGLCDRAKPREGEDFFILEFQANGFCFHDGEQAFDRNTACPTDGTKESD